ncbi:hypothetical protein G4B88_017837 [Cannabis sativa]|uniref:RRM domain-containing protein n=1 Tax=Cannabis sativa TaxID=3483 RepID=A0A7J6GQ23_CANSA|nr:hypothetical protein G4B88_017837 [Cannabis sativa]
MSSRDDTVIAMAFFSKLGNILRQSATKQISSEVSPFKLSMSQAVRCMCSMASSKLFIGGISYQTDEQSLREAFAKYGEIVDGKFLTIFARDNGWELEVIFGFCLLCLQNTYLLNFLQQELLLIVTLVDPEDLDLSLSLLVKRHPVLSRLWMDSYGASSGASYGGNSVDYGNNTGSYNAAAGAPSTDNFSGSFGGSGNFGVGYDASTGSSGNAGGDDSFGDNKPDAPLEGSYRDDDDTNDFAKRA